MIAHSFEFDGNLVGVRNAQDLLQLKWMGDKPEQKQLFLKAYVNIVTKLKESLFAEEGWRDILENCIKDSKDLDFEFESFKAAPIHNRVHTHKYLLDMLAGSIERDQAKAARAKSRRR